MSHRRRYLEAIAIASFAFLLELWGSGFTHSAALWGDAWHVFGDGSTLATGLLALELKNRGKHAGQLELVTSLLNMLVLLVAAVLLARWGLVLLAKPVPVSGYWLLAIAGIGAACNLRQWHLARGLAGAHTHEHTRLGQVLHFASDFCASMAVIAGAIGTLMGYPHSDAIASLVVAVIILAFVGMLGKEVWGADRHRKHRH